MISPFDIETTLNLLGCTSPKALPGFSKCPICNGIIRVYKRPWFYCANCQFAGDPIKLVEVSQNILVDEVFSRLRSFSKTSIDNTKMSMYISIRDLHEKVNSFWMHCQNNRPQPEFRRICQETGLYNIYKSKLLNVGLCQKEDLSLLPESYVNNVSLKDNRWKYALVVPLEAAPGCITAFYLITTRGECIARIGPYEDVGFAFYRSISPDTGPIIIGTDIKNVLNLHASHTNVTNKDSIPVIGYASEGSPWEDISNVQHIISTKESKILSMLPFISIGSDTKINLNPKLRVRDLVRKSRPWQVIAREYMSKNPFDMAAIVSALNLTEHQKGDFLNYCNRRQRKHLAKIISTRNISRQIQYGPNTIIENSDGYYLKPKSGSIYKVSNIRFHIESITKINDSTNLIYTGKIYFDDNFVEFREESTVLKASLIEWLENVAIDNNMPLPNISKRFSRSLVEIGNLFNPPRYIKIKDIAKCTGESEIDFPCINIKDGEVKLTGESLPDYPCGRLIYPVSNPIPKLGSCSGTALWQLFIPILANFIAPITGWSRNTIGILSDSGASSALATLMNDLQFPVYTIAGEKPDLKIIDSINSKYDTPVILKYPERIYNAVVKSTTATSLNCIIECKPIMGDLSIVMDGFVCIGTEAVGLGNSAIRHIMVDYLRWFTANPVVEDTSRPLYSTYKTLLNWNNDANYIDRQILLDAWKGIDTHEKYGDNRFIEFFNRVLRSSHFSTAVSDGVINLNTLKSIVSCYNLDIDAIANIVHDQGYADRSTGKLQIKQKEKVC